MSPITVVIPALNAAATLGEQLSALRTERVKTTFTVVVVDNGSVDSTNTVADSFNSEALSVKVVAAQPAGVNIARNAGIAAAGDGIVLLCDADDVVQPGWVAALAAAVDEAHWAGGCVDYTTLNTARVRTVWNAPVRASPVSTDPAFDRTFGGNCGFTVAMWDRVGRFDERLSGAGDENEFFARAAAAGYQLREAPDAVLSYRLRPGLRAMALNRYRSGVSQAAAATRAGGSAFAPLVRPTTVVLTLAKLLVTAPAYVASAPRRAIWVAATGRAMGRLAGWVRYRKGQPHPR